MRENVHQIVWYADDTGADDGPDFKTLQEALDYARKRIQENGFEGFTVYDRQEKKIEAVEGRFPERGIFVPEIYYNSGMMTLDEYNRARLEGHEFLLMIQTPQHDVQTAGTFHTLAVAQDAGNEAIWGGKENQEKDFAARAHVYKS